MRTKQGSWRSRTLSKESVYDALNGNRGQLSRSQRAGPAPRSRVHATVAEWYHLEPEGLKRGIFEEIAQYKVFRSRHNEMMLNGARGDAHALAYLGQ
jgi:hypothetical protein